MLYEISDRQRAVLIVALQALKLAKQDILIMGEIVQDRTAVIASAYGAIARPANAKAVKTIARSL